MGLGYLADDDKFNARVLSTTSITGLKNCSYRPPNLGINIYQDKALLACFSIDYFYCF